MVFYAQHFFISFKGVGHVRQGVKTFDTRQIQPCQALTHLSLNSFVNGSCLLPT